MRIYILYTCHDLINLPRPVSSVLSTCFPSAPITFCYSVAVRETTSGPHGMTRKYVCNTVRTEQGEIKGSKTGAG
jgi:hypothetical protein